MPTSTYTALANITLGSAQAAITFGSIPATYRDLILVLVGGSASNQSIWLQFNGDTGSNYPWVYMGANGSSAFAGTSTTTGLFVGSSLNNNNNNFISEILDYSTTDKHKLVLAKDTNTSGQMLRIAGRWSNTAAINQIRIFGNGSHNLNSGFSAALYGIAS